MKIANEFNELAILEEDEIKDKDDLRPRYFVSLRTPSAQLVKRIQESGLEDDVRDFYYKNGEDWDEKIKHMREMLPAGQVRG